MTKLSEAPSLQTISHDIVDHVTAAKREAGIRGRAPIILGLVTETMDGPLPRAIELFGNRIMDAVDAAAFEWRSTAHRHKAMIGGEELIISVALA